MGCSDASRAELSLSEKQLFGLLSEYCLLAGRSLLAILQGLNKLSDYVEKCSKNRKEPASISSVVSPHSQTPSKNQDCFSLTHKELTSNKQTAKMWASNAFLN